MNRVDTDGPRAADSLVIDLPRLRSDIEALARFGHHPGDDGIYRPSFSAADMAARRWLMARLEKQGLTVHMDGVGNVWGRWECGAGPAVIVGSHLDSVPCGGRLDGALGVMAALECVRTLKESGVQTRHPVEILATSEEEGRFGGMLGSQSLCGAVSREWLYSARDDNGVSLIDAMADQGLKALDALTLRRDPATVKAFVELHIEQGPVLHQQGLPVGIVEGISGMLNWSITLQGRANHAGTTPMDLRADAMAGLAEFAAALPGMAALHGTPHSRLTIGRVELQPNFPHTVPGRADFSLVVRDMDAGVIAELARHCRERLDQAALAHRLALTVQEVSRLDPQPSHPDIIALLLELADQLDIPSLVMASGAGHDTQFMAQLAPAGMIFVPSIDGVSHAPEEATAWSDIEAGANLLLHAVARLAL
jgi:N-carbamoyl-L-amino-acid hydrolase